MQGPIVRWISHDASTMMGLQVCLHSSMIKPLLKQTRLIECSNMYNGLIAEWVVEITCLCFSQASSRLQCARVCRVSLLKLQCEQC